MEVPFNRAGIVGREREYLEQAISCGQIGGEGEFIERCEHLIRDMHGVEWALLTNSCTAALEMSAMLLGIGRDDEVILPSFAFSSTVNAFMLRGARPVFVDIRPDTLNIDPDQLAAAISPRTRAIVLVHYAGVSCDLDAIMAVAERHDLPIVEDSAHGPGGEYKGRPLGSFGRLSTLSFHQSKNIICGEGGALLGTVADDLPAAEIIREKGTDRASFFRGAVDRYTWRSMGSSYVISNLLAAFLYAQLEVRDKIRADRLRIWNEYDRELRDWAAVRGIQLPFVPRECSHPACIYYLLFEREAHRDSFIAHLRTRGVHAVFHYLPLHLAPAAQALDSPPVRLPVTEAVSARLARLPLYPSMSEGQCDHVVATAITWRP